MIIPGCICWSVLASRTPYTHQPARLLNTVLNWRGTILISKYQTWGSNMGTWTRGIHPWNHPQKWWLLRLWLGTNHMLKLAVSFSFLLPKFVLIPLKCPGFYSSADDILHSLDLWFQRPRPKKTIIGKSFGPQTPPDKKKNQVTWVKFPDFMIGWISTTEQKKQLRGG